MDKEQLIELYNPSNSKSLTEENVKQLAGLSNEDLKVLAEAYPNKPTSNNYLVLKNTKLADDKQTYQLSTFANLYALRTRHNAANFIPISFRDIFQYPSMKVAGTSIAQKAAPQDLTKQQALSSEGLKAATPAHTENENINSGSGQHEEFTDLSGEAAKHATQQNADKSATTKTKSK